MPLGTLPSRVCWWTNAAGCRPAAGETGSGWRVRTAVPWHAFAQDRRQSIDKW